MASIVFNRVLPRYSLLSSCKRELKAVLSIKKPCCRHTNSPSSGVVDVQNIVKKQDDDTSKHRDAMYRSSRQMFDQSAPAAKSPYGEGRTKKSVKVAVKNQDGTRPGPRPRKGSVGALNRVPTIPMASELVVSALKRASRVGPTKGMKNEAAKARNLAAKQLDALTKELTVPMGRWLGGFPRAQTLHPFEQALLELTLGDGRYERTLGRVDSLRKRLLEMGKSHAGRAAKAKTRFDALAIRDAGFAELETVYKKESVAVEKLKEISRELRKLPVIEPEVPTLVLVGAPNVGKSSLVRMLSSGQPEVQNYPFTTRGIQLGHFFMQGERHIVTDTPGLLNRKEEDRNAMERLTLASVQHLPTSVLFVTDLTGLCGTSPATQLEIRAKLRAEFPDRPWVDVLSKGDLLPSPSSSSSSSDIDTPYTPLPSEPTESSDVDDQLPTQELVAPPVGSVSYIQDKDALQKAVLDAEKQIPDALRVSIISQEGLDSLKSNVINMLQTKVECETEQ